MLLGSFSFLHCPRMISRNRGSNIRLTGRKYEISLHAGAHKIVSPLTMASTITSISRFTSCPRFLVVSTSPLLLRSFHPTNTQSHSSTTLLSMKKINKKLRYLLILTAVLLIYPACVIAYTWTHVLRSDLEGGRHGPLDAYRHTLASAVVSHTIGGWAVDLVSNVFECSGKESNLMDRKNNAIGAAIGESTDSFGQLEAAVFERVSAGAEYSTEPDQSTWLPKDQWRDARFW